MTTGTREVARALLLDEEGRVMLVRWRDPATGTAFWEPPGGGREPQETYEEALRREVAEETGVPDIEVGDCVAELERRFTWNNREYSCFERYFLCRPVGNERVALTLEEVEQDGFVETKWWDRDELRATDEDLEPPGLLAMLELDVDTP